MEIGSGQGFLAAQLPPELAKRTILTEPAALGVERLKTKFPDFDVQRARADQLPVESGSVAAIVACCVFDVLPSLSRTFDEFVRVLKPGGVVLHVLDLATDLGLLFDEIISDGELLPFPNVFTDPGATDWPQDILLAPVGQIDLIVEVLGNEKPGVWLREYRTAFTKNAASAVSAFSWIQESTENRNALRSAFSTAMQLASSSQREELAAFSGRPLSSAFVFHQRLRALTLDEFTLDSCDRVAETGFTPLGSKGPNVYRSNLGYIQSGRAAPGVVPEGKCRTELAVHVFRATKV